MFFFTCHFLSVGWYKEVGHRRRNLHRDLYVAQLPSAESHAFRIQEGKCKSYSEYLSILACIFVCLFVFYSINSFWLNSKSFSTIWLIEVFSSHETRSDLHADFNNAVLQLQTKPAKTCQSG